MKAFYLLALIALISLTSCWEINQTIYGSDSSGKNYRIITTLVNPDGVVVFSADEYIPLNKVDSAYRAQYDTAKDIRTKLRSAERFIKLN